MMFKRWKLCAIASLLLGMSACAQIPPTKNAFSEEPPPITIQGHGNQTTGPYQVAEGTLTFHIIHTTDCEVCAAVFNVEQDNNLDGTFCGAEDGLCSYVFQAGYEGIQGLDTIADYTTEGGMINIDVEAPGDWEITIEQKPSPMHAIAGNVQAPLVKDGETYADILVFVQGALVEAVDAQGNRFSAVTDEIGDYTLKVYGFTDYTVMVSAPGYTAATQTVGAQDFLGLGFPIWEVEINFILQAEATN